MKIFSIITLLGVLFLASCSSNLTNLQSWKKVAKVGDTVVVDYIGRFPDGTVFDTSIEAEAKKAGKYMTGRPYQPLPVQLWSQQVVPGFEAALMGVTEGQFKPSVEIPPSQAYGEKEIIQSIPLEEVIGPKNQYVPLKHLGPKLLEEVPVSLLEEAGQKVKAGATFTLTGADSQITKGKILSVTHEIAKVEIENPLAPFGSKKITKGLVGKSGLAKVTVLSLSGSDAQLSIEPLFYADLTPGKKVSIPNGESFIVESKTEKELKIRVPNTHDLAGKTLIFDLYIRSITSAPKEASANEKK